MEVLLILCTGLVNALCFFIGAKVGNTVANGKEIETPTIKSPLEAYREIKDSKKAREELDRLETIMRNIESYDGTSNHQADIPN